MPLYEYRCEACDREFEAYKRPSENSEREPCPSCGKDSLRMGLSLFRARGGSPAAGGSSCGSGPRRSPFG